MSSSPLSGTTNSVPLPPAPASQTGPVKAWSAPVELWSNQAPLKEKNPVFTDGKSKLVGYPLAASEPSHGVPALRSWKAVHLENEFLRLMILPELGGRIYLGIDKANDSEFLYREETLDASQTPIPGGLAIQFPADSRRRPAAPVFVHIEESADGSRTVWCSAYDPILRLKGMHGIGLYPGRSYFEIKARLFNGTTITQPFNWSTLTGVPAPRNSVAVFPELTSGRDNDFLGTYCSESNLGLLQVADSHVASGQSFTQEAEYGQLRAGMYSGLPPRVSLLAPSETKSFSQYWFPFTNIGSIQKATVDVAVHLCCGEVTTVGAVVTRSFAGASVALETEGNILNRWIRDLVPGQPFLEETTLPAGIDPANVTLKVLTSAGRELISFSPLPASSERPESIDDGKQQMPPAPPPRKAATVEQLYLNGFRAGQDSTVPYKPEEYWSEALRRDPHHVGSNNAMGLLQLQRGEFGEAESRFRTAISALATAGSDSEQGESFYNLGVALRFQEQDEEAYAAFQRAAWSYAWRAPALQAAAELDCKRKNFGVVPKYLYEALRLNADNNNARNLAVVLFRRFGRAAEAEHLVRESLTVDPLDPWACQLAGRPFPGDNQARLDLAFLYTRCGLYELGVEVLTAADSFANDGSLPMIHYTLASLYMRMGDLHAAQREYQTAAATKSDFCFPHRLEEMMVLARAIALQPEDARAQYYLGCLLSYYGLTAQAIEIWQSSANLDAQFPSVWRNLALGHYNITGDAEKALDAFDRAVSLDPADSRLALERDQLWQRLGVPPALRQEELQRLDPSLAGQEDLALALACLYNTSNEPEKARDIFSSHKIPGWEHNPKAVDQYVRTYIKLGRQALSRGDFESARDLFLHPLSTSAVFTADIGCVPKSVELQFWIGEAMNAAGHREAALTYWQKAINLCHQSVKSAPFNEMTFFVALALGRVGERTQSRKLLRELWFSGRRLAREKPPASASSDGFKDETAKCLRVRGLLWQSQARIGLGQYRLAGRLLEQLLSLDPNHDRALDFISDLEHGALNR